jgi:hypothetical protein
VTHPPGAPLAACAVTAHAAVTLPLAAIDGMRTTAGPPGSKPVPLKHVKNADEQTIAGLSALFHAIHAGGWQDRSFRDWAVVGAPRYLGRMSVALTTNRYLKDPAYSVSPNIIPNQSLHSPSGTVSVLLGIQGPNFGVGGGPNAVPEGLVAALSALQQYRPPGVWLLLTEFDPEPRPGIDGKPTNAVHVNAVALALEPGDGPARLRLLTDVSGPAALTVGDLAVYVGAGFRDGRAWRCPVAGLGTIELLLK